MTSRTDAIQQLLALRNLVGAAGSIHVWRRQRDGKIVGAYFMNDGGAWVYNRKARADKQIYRWEIDSLRRLVGGWKRRKCFEKLEHRSEWWGVDIGSNLAAITRRAYIPTLVTQIYQPSPLMSLLKPKP